MLWFNLFRVFYIVFRQYTALTDYVFMFHNLELGGYMWFRLIYVLLVVFIDYKAMTCSVFMFHFHTEGAVYVIQYRPCTIVHGIVFW